MSPALRGQTVVLTIDPRDLGQVWVHLHPSAYVHARSPAPVLLQVEA